MRPCRLYLRFPPTLPLLRRPVLPQQGHGPTLIARPGPRGASFVQTADPDHGASPWEGGPRDAPARTRVSSLSDPGLRVRLGDVTILARDPRRPLTDDRYAARTRTLW